MQELALLCIATMQRASLRKKIRISQFLQSSVFSHDIQCMLLCEHNVVACLVGLFVWVD